MNALEVSKRAIDAWNSHDADALIAQYAEDASYNTPRFDHPLKGQAIADFLKSVLKAYPDVRFEVISRGDIGGGLIATQLVLRATQTGAFMDGTPATGRTVAYPIASFVQIEGDKIRAEHVYFDRQTVAEQLGFTPKKNLTLEKTWFDPIRAADYESTLTRSPSSFGNQLYCADLCPKSKIQ